MKTFLLILAIFNFSILSFGQSINAGVWNSNDYYFDFNPDRTMARPPSHQVNIFEIDLNGDTINDVRLTSIYREGWQWYDEHRLTIQGLNQAQIAYSKIDTCESNDFPPVFVYSKYLAKELNHNDLINNGLNWTDSIVNLSYSEFSATQPTNSGFGCTRVSQFQSDSGFIAVRLIKPADTLYSWIKISNVGYDSCIIHEFACNTKLTHVNKNFNSEGIVIYPNPSSGAVELRRLNLNDGLTDIKIFNSIGQLQLWPPINKINSHVDLSFLPSGLYFLHIKTSSGNMAIKKVMIVKN